MKVKKPCYTCKDSFIQTKRQYLLQEKIKDVEELAKKDGFTGTYAIIERNNGTGFVAVRKDEYRGKKRPVEYLLFNQGIAFR